ncbi:MAG: hypothetical protein ACE5NG_19465, partial [bacterium]
MEMERIVNRCLEKEPQDRYQHISEIIENLHQVKKTFELKNQRKQVRAFVGYGLGFVMIIFALFLLYFRYFGKPGET